MTWVLLAGAILSEVAATLCLRIAAMGSTRWYAPVGVGYLLSLGFLYLALLGGLPIGIAYGVWAASGVAITAVASRVLFEEPLTRLMVVGIATIVLGVLLVELGTG
jgi:small multidrug resistance pump